MKPIGQELANDDLLIESDPPPIFVCHELRVFFTFLNSWKKKGQYFITRETDMKFKLYWSLAMHIRSSLAASTMRWQS